MKDFYALKRQMELRQAQLSNNQILFLKRMIKRLLLNNDQLHTQVEELIVMNNAQLLLIVSLQAQVNGQSATPAVVNNFNCPVGQVIGNVNTLNYNL